MHLKLRRKAPLADGQSIGDIVKNYLPNLTPFEETYKDLHQHPELSCQEARTASVAAKAMKEIGFEVHESIGGHGVAAVYRNGSGPTVLLRAEMDALPVQERTGLPYASTATMKDSDGVIKPVSHACGHDMHVVCLIAAANLLHSANKSWQGILVFIFQPNEERGGGARAMVSDGLYSSIGVPTPDVVLGQHVVNTRAGWVSTRAGPTLAGKQTYTVKLHGRGGHGSAPQDCIDPVVMAAYTIIRLQSIVSREVDPTKMALLTCGSLHAGDAPNVIPNEANLKVDIRAFEPKLLDRSVSAFRRIVNAESEASGAPVPPEIAVLECVPPLVNDVESTNQVRASFEEYFGPHTEGMGLDSAADDFVILAPEGVPYVYWNFGCTEPSRWEELEKKGKLDELPNNHSDHFAPMIQPTMKTGTEALAVAALTFLNRID